MKHGGTSSQRNLQAAVQQQQSQRSQERVRAVAQAQQPQKQQRTPEILVSTSIRGKAGIIQQQSQAIRRPNLNSNVETGCIQKRSNEKSSNRSPYTKTRNPANIQSNPNLNATPTHNDNRSSYQNMQTAFSTKNFSLRESNDSLRSSAYLKTSLPNGLPGQGSTNTSQQRTQRHLQKSVENLHGHKVASSKSREKHLRNQAQNVNASSNFTQYQNQGSHGQQSSKTQRQWGDHITRQQQLRASAESHVSGTSGISGILGNTQLTAGASVSVLQAQNSNQKQQTQIIDTNDRNSDEIIIGSTVLRQPKQAAKIQNQQVYHIQSQDSEHERNYGNRGAHQQSQSSASALLQSYDQGEKRHHNIMSSGSYGFNEGGSHKNNQSTFSNQLQLITSNLQNKVCNSIEEAQPILRLCLNNVGHSTVNMTQVTQGANQFTSILSDNEIDQNLVCPACKFIVVNPVECQSCQYIICYKCSIQSNNQCQEESCREKFTQQPGKIHKLYRAMLNQLEFRCPNQGAGCQELLKYDQLDEHLKEECENRDQICPNQCSSVKIPACQIKEHLMTTCPKELVICPECQSQVQRGHLQNHLENECERVQIKCEQCDQFDFKMNFKSGQHDCISLLKNAISKIQENTERTEEDENVPSTARLRSGDQRPRALDDFKQNIENNQSKQQAHDIDILNRQVQNLKVDMQNLDTIVTDDIFRMFDNMSLCVTQKDDEVKQLAKKVAVLEDSQKQQQEAMVSQQTEFEGLLAALDLKYQEMIEQMQRNQKQEIDNMKTTLIQDLEANIADQLATHSSLTQQSNRIPQREEQKIAGYHSLRNSGKRKSGGHQKVPSLNFGKQAVQDIGLEGQQSIDQPMNLGNYPPPLSQRNISRGSGVRSNKQSQDNQEEEDFVPFLSSTDNELTDLNTEFNTDRPLYAESSGPQSTYRSKPKKTSQIVPNQRQSTGQMNSMGIPNQRGAYASQQPPKTQSQQLDQEEFKRGDAGINSQRAYQQQTQGQSYASQKQPMVQDQTKQEEGTKKVSKTGSSDLIAQGNHQQLGLHPQATSGITADMSFDNESVTNPNQAEKGQSPMSQNGQDQNDSFTNTDVEDANDQNLQQRQQQPQQTNDNMLIQDCVQAEQYFDPVAPPNTQQEGQAYYSQQSRQIDQMQQDGDKYQSKTEVRSQEKKNQQYASNQKSHQSNQFVSILDESSDLEQINNHQLPGSIHGGMTNSSGFGSHLQSLNSQHSNQSTINASHINQNQSQFSALSRGQLFGGNQGPSSRNGSNEFSSGPIGLSGKTGLESALITDRQLSGERTNHLAMQQSLESLEAFQVNLDKNVLLKTISENTNSDFQNQQKQDPNFNQYKQIKVQQQQDKPLSRIVEEEKGEQRADGDLEAYQNLEQLIQSASSSHAIQEQKTAEQQDNELVENLKQETQNMIDQIKQKNSGQIIQENALEQFENQVNAMGLQKQNSETIQSRRSGIGEDTDMEGNETENEQIKEHLDHLEAIGADKQEGGGIHSALRGLESDLETIFETDMESNYVTTARTNLSTKKLLNQLAQNHPNQDQEKLTQILMSQFSPIARSGHGSQSHNSHSNFKRKGGSSSKKEYNSNLLPSQVVANSKHNNHLNLQQKQLDFDDVVSPDGGNGTGTDTSQSCLISARSHNRQEVHNTQMKNQPGVENVNTVSENYVEKGQTKIQQPHGQCYLTHKELEKLGSKQNQQSQLDREERRIRVYSDKQTSHSAPKSADHKKAHNLREGPSTLSPRNIEQKDQQTINNHLSNFLSNQEIIQEEDIETEGEDLQQTGHTSQSLHPQKIQSTLSSAQEQIHEFLGQNPIETQELSDGTTVDILKGIRQNLKDKFQNQDILIDQEDQDFANAQAQIGAAQEVPQNADLEVLNNEKRDSSRSFENEEDEYDDNQGNFQFK